MDQAKKKNRAAAYILGILYGFATTFGYQAQCYGEIRVKSPVTYLTLLFWSLTATGFFLLTWEGLCFRSEKKAEKKPAAPEDRKVPGFIWPVSSVSVFLLWFITFLGIFPGFFVYDAGYELDEVLKRSFDTQHPMFHVLSLGGVIQAVHKLNGDYNIAIAVFILFQAAVMAVIFGWAIRELIRGKASRRPFLFQILAILYLGLFPVIVMYALCSAKDGLFTAFMLMTILYIRRYLKDDTDFRNLKSISSWLLVGSAVLMMLYRNNGIYAFLIFAAFGALILYLGKKNETRFFLFCLLSILLYGVLNRGLLLATHARDVGHREILTVPIQQMARVVSFDPKSLSEEEKSAVLRYIPEEGIRHYAPKCSDEVKIEFDEGAYEEDKAGFYRLYLTLGLKHPAAYLDAWIMTSYGLWYPNAVIDGYGGRSVYTFTYGESSYFGYETEPPGERRSLIPAIDRFYRFLSLDPWIQRAPMLRLLFAPGFILWIYLYFFGYLIYSGRSETALPYILPLCVVFTCLFGPMSLVRYVWYLWIFAPLIMYESFVTGERLTDAKSPKIV